MLKAEPLTVDEVDTYGVGHVNMHTSGTVGKAYNQNGYGAVQWYSSETCGYNGSSWVRNGCVSNYDNSEIKYIVAAWAADKINEEDIFIDSSGLYARLITLDELKDNLGYGDGIVLTDDVPNFIYNSKYEYWTMSTYATINVWKILYSGNISINGQYYGSFGTEVVRPVVTLKKSALE